MRLFENDGRPIHQVMSNKHSSKLVDTGAEEGGDNRLDRPKDVLFFNNLMSLILCQYVPETLRLCLPQSGLNYRKGS